MDGKDAAERPSAAGMLWERAAQAALTSGDWATAIEHAGRARDYHLQRGQARAAARAQAIAGQALRQWGRHGEAREQLSAAVEVLRADPDTDTVRALEELAVVEVFAGSPDADRLTIEALTLGQALGVATGQLGGLLLTRGIYLSNDRAASSGGRLLPRSRAARHPGRRQHAPGARAAQPCRTCWRPPTPRPRRKPPAPPPGTCAGLAPGTTWRTRSPTWSRRC